MLIRSDKSLIGQLSPAELVIVYWLLVVIRSSSLESPVCRIETFLSLIVMLIVQLASLSPGVVTRSVPSPLSSDLQCGGACLMTISPLTT